MTAAAVPADPRIRPVTPADVDRVTELVHALAAYERAPELCHLTAEQLTAALFGERPSLHGLVARETDDPATQVAGFALWFLNFSTWDGVHGIYLEDLFVSPEHRGSGLGKALLIELAHIAEVNGYSRVEWSVLDWNAAAIEFYRAIGAVPMTGWTTYRLAGNALADLPTGWTRPPTSADDVRALLVVNPHATSTTPVLRDLLAHALASEVDLAVQHTAGRGHAAELAATAVDRGAELLVVHGGDGTINEVVNGMMYRAGPGRAPLLAVVPGGSTNVFARALGVAQDPMGATEQILSALTRHRPPRTISLGRADERFFTFNAGLGLDAEVVKAVEDVRERGRRISNSLHVRKTVRRYAAGFRQPPRLTVAPAEGAVETGVHLLFVSNVDPWTYWHQRPVHTNPGVSAAGGLGVFALRNLGLPTVLRVTRQLLRDPRPGRSWPGPRSRHLVRLDDVPSVTAKASSPIGLQLDGDYLGLRSGVTFVSIPDALRVLGPPVS